MGYKFNVFTGTLDLVGNSSSGSGNVTGIPPTTPNAIARWVDALGTTIQDSPNTNIQDSGAILAQGFITQDKVTNPVLVDNDQTWIAPDLTLQGNGDVIVNLNGTILIVG